MAERVRSIVEQPSGVCTRCVNVSVTLFTARRRCAATVVSPGGAVTPVVVSQKKKVGCDHAAKLELSELCVSVAPLVRHAQMNSVLH